MFTSATLITNVSHVVFLTDYKNLDLPKTQETIGRLISFGIKATWTEEELSALVAKMTTSIKAALGQTA